MYYRQQVEFPEGRVLGVAVFRVVKLGKVYTTSLHLIIKQQVTLGKCLCRQRKSHSNMHFIVLSTHEFVFKESVTTNTKDLLYRGVLQLNYTYRRK